ncbi:GNAT family N-acetyltransferase [Lentzea tibetensis]|uniref:GNAT family N-acetyltransferase n=1 Tax=Lentzea tibetensis TaxID=2591470 RepID=A0A563EFJ6_9PSEU|nr:GNAT family N-acyltransferase [Lentzea tibetensis]TWP44033.1 GNAT family N-acetyltransferase [Lentzea tibetensis]
MSSEPHDEVIEVDDFDEGVSVRPRVRDLFAEAAEAVDALDPVVVDCHCSGSHLSVREANSLPRRSAVLDLRTRYHAEALRGFGVSTWDAYDESAVHLLCYTDDTPIGAIRLVSNSVERGELVEDFGPLVLEGFGPEFVTFGREIVVPSHRGAGVSTVLGLAACAYWFRSSPVDDLVVTAASSAAPALEHLGLRRLTGTVHLGPARMPAVIMAGKVSDAYQRTRERLSGKGWSIVDR